jgi:hypothetical protein
MNPGNIDEGLVCVNHCAMNFYTGIMLLEKQILQISEDTRERPTKRQRTSASPSPETTTTWIELSK